MLEKADELLEVDEVDQQVEDLFDRQSEVAHDQQRSDFCGARTEIADPEDTHMDFIIQMMLSKLTGDLELDFVKGLQRLIARQEGAPIHHAAACAGCEIQAKVRQAFTRVIKATYNLDLEFKHSVSAEISPENREFLLSQHSIDALAGNNTDLFNTMFPNLARGGRKDIVPHMDSYSSGVVCTSRTPASSKSASNVNCVQNGTGATGESWLQSKQIIKAHLPSLITLECVNQLFEKVPLIVEVFTSKVGTWELQAK